MNKLNPTLETMLAHRSIREFQDKPISKETLEQLIRCGQAASSSSFIQGYSIIQVTDKAVRQQISEAAGGQAYIIQAAEFLVFCADLKRIDSACQTHNRGALEGHTEHFIAATIDVSLLAQNILLAAESMGLGGVFIGGIRNDPQLLTDLLKLPEQVYPVFGMCLGWAKSDPEVKPRFPTATILHHNQYSTDGIEDKIKQYDEKMQDYYQARSSNNRVSNWSSQTSKTVQLKQRAFMLGYLNKQGLLKK